MTATDQQKVLDAGFLIIRKEPDCSEKYEAGSCTAKIKQKTKENRDWHILEKGFKSNYAMEQRVKELLKDRMTVLD